MQNQWVKLITLNAWGGKVREELEQFITQEAETTDVFCFQEVFKGGMASSENNDIKIKGANPSLYEDLTRLLPSHRGLFCPVHKDEYGLALFVRSTFEVLESGEILIHTNGRFPDPENEHADHTRKLQWALLRAHNRDFLVMNLHGYWMPEHKNDTPERLVQSQKILEFIHARPMQKILCGDFNLAPDTESIQMLGKEFINLITTTGATSTRTALYPYASTDPIADYIFTSPEITVQGFRILPDVVSDHSPLSLTFDLA